MDHIQTFSNISIENAEKCVEEGRSSTSACLKSPPDHSAVLMRSHSISAIQIEYSPFATEIEFPGIDLLQTCHELGVAIVVYSPLGRGMLTGAYKSPADFKEGDCRKGFPRFSEENFPKNLKLVNQINEIAEKRGCTAGQLSLAWLSQSCCVRRVAFGPSQCVSCRSS